MSDPTKAVRDALAAGNAQAVREAASLLHERAWDAYDVPPDAVPCRGCGELFSPGIYGDHRCLRCVVAAAPEVPEL
jgi:hypothetical protein